MDNIENESRASSISRSASRESLVDSEMETSNANEKGKNKRERNSSNSSKEGRTNAVKKKTKGIKK